MVWVIILINVYFVEIIFFKIEIFFVIMGYWIFFCFIVVFVIFDLLKGLLIRKKCFFEVDLGNVIIKGGYNVLNLCLKSI